MNKHVYVYNAARNQMVGEYDIPESGVPIEAAVHVATYVRGSGASLASLVYLVALGGGEFPAQCKRAVEAMSYDASTVRVTPREQQVLVGIVAGKQNKEIADDLHLSERTVKFHVSSLLAKHNCRGRVELAAIAAKPFLAGVVAVPNPPTTN